MPFYSYRCEAGHEQVLRRGYGDESALCGCGLSARRSFANVPYIHGATTPKFQPDAERFLDRAADINYAYERAEQEVGAPLARPKGLGAGSARARAQLLRERGPKDRLTKEAFALDKRIMGD